MTARSRTLAVAITVAACAAALPAAAAGAAVFTVGTTADGVDSTPGDGACSGPSGCTLRAAVQEANALAGPDEVDVPAGTYPLTVTAQGDIDVTQALTIAGAGAGSTIVDAAGLGDRVFDATAVPLTLSGMTLRNGVVSGDGGDVQTQGTLSLSGVVIEKGSANDGGGVYAGDALTATNSIVRDNTEPAGGDGGGIYGLSTVSLTDVTLSGNHLGGIGDGGGLYSFDRATLTRVAISGNSVGGDADGGGAYLFSGGDLRDVAVSGNTIDHGDGAGLYVDDSSSLERVTLSGNRATGSGIAEGGGGYFLSGTTPITLTNVTVTANDVGSGPGGGIYFNGAMTLLHTTVSGNVGGQGAVFGGATVRARSSILAGSPACGSPIGSDGTNLASDGTCGLAAGGDRSGLDPKLGGLTSDGGFTQVLPLLDGSPAIDAADAAHCPATDQRGVARPQGAGCDIGAYERTVAAPAPTPAASATPSPTPTPVAQKPAPLRAKDVIVFPSSKRCVSRRHFAIHLRRPGGVKLASATVFVNGKRVKVLKGKRLTSVVDLRGLPKGRFTVKIIVRTVKGQKVTGTRTYHTCVAKRKSHRPPKL